MSCFPKRSLVDIWQGFEYAFDSEYPRVLNSLGFWICPWFWMCHSFEYSRVLNMPLVLNMQRFWICHSSELGLHRIQNKPGYPWIFLDIPEYAGICVNILEHVVTYFICKSTQKIRGYSLKEHEAVFLKRKIFSIAVGGISFVFCFSLNIFTSKIKICCYQWVGRGLGTVNINISEAFFSPEAFSTTPYHWNCGKLMIFCCLRGDWKSISNRFSAWGAFSTPFRLSLLWVYLPYDLFFFFNFCPKTGIFSNLSFVAL